LLKYIHDALEVRAFATVGYYIGGMKEKDLKISEGKNIIIATYKMAEEALDIKTLTTIVMATPKKDVRQAVGRILRTDGPKTVVDFIDQHEMFQRHWTQRRRWYNRQKFDILQTTVEGYKTGVWIPYQKGGCNSMPTSINLLHGKCLTHD
jgi:superfamily II DNA or RNA helicase